MSEKRIFQSAPGVRFVPSAMRSILVCVSLAGALCGGIIASVEPEVRLERPGNGELASQAGQAQILDAYIQVAEATNIEVMQLVPKSTVISYCGDGDGCTMRLFLANPATVNGINPRGKYSERFFSTLEDGSKWVVMKSDELPEWEGDTEDSQVEPVIRADDGTQSCSVIDEPVFSSFQLEAIPDGIDIRCVLRIED